MSQHEPDHTGSLSPRPFSGPRSRLTERESKERLFHAAEELIGRTGLTVGLDHLRFEDIIHRAGVARSAAYRIFPHKEQFYADLLCRLAGPSWAGTAAWDADTITVAAATLVAHLPEMGTADGRWRAMLEASRLGAEQNFKSLISSSHWRTYIALSATVMSMPDGEMKSKLADALRAAEQEFLERMASFYDVLSRALGIRLRAEFGTDFRVLAASGAAVIEGLGLRNSINPGMVKRRFDRFSAVDPTPRDWSLAAIGFTAILASMVEADPDWDPRNLELLRELAADEPDR